MNSGLKDKEKKKKRRKPGSDKSDPLLGVRRFLKNYERSMSELARLAEPSVRGLEELIQKLPQQALVSTQRLVFTDMAAKGLMEPFNHSIQIIEEAIRKTQYVVPSYYPLPELKIIERVPKLTKGSRELSLAQSWQTARQVIPPGANFRIYAAKY